MPLNERSGPVRQFKRRGACRLPTRQSESFLGPLAFEIGRWPSELSIRKRKMPITEPAELYCHNMRTAHKAHVCCECRGVIRVGEKYHYHHGIWGGRAADYKVCLNCEELRGEVDADAGDIADTTPFGGMAESVDGVGCPALWRRFVAIKDKRGAVVPSWMRQKVTEPIV